MLVSASILSIKDEIEKIHELDNIDIDYIHLDIMDGVFVPNFSFNKEQIKNIVENSNKFIDAHLMVEKPIDYLDLLNNINVKYITIHYENLDINVLEKIKKMGIKCGIAIKPNTNIESIYSILPLIDLVLVMSVEPGFGGQKFIENTALRIELLKKEIEKRNLNVLISVDGGININSSSLCKESGANMVVIGTALMTSTCKEDFIKSVK